MKERRPIVTRNLGVDLDSHAVEDEGSYGADVVVESLRDLGKRTRVVLVYSSPKKLKLDWAIRCPTLEVAA